MSPLNIIKIPLKTCVYYSVSACTCMHVCVSVFLVWVPEEPVGRWAPIGNVIEEDLQLVVIVKVCSNDCSDRRWHGKLLGCYILTHTHTYTQISINLYNDCYCVTVSKKTLWLNLHQRLCPSRISPMKWDSQWYFWNNTLNSSNHGPGLQGRGCLLFLSGNICTRISCVTFHLSHDYWVRANFNHIVVA